MSEQSSPENKRPSSVTSLLCNGGIYPEWYFANKGKNRFYVANLVRVMGLIDLKHTLTRSSFREAKDVIERETDWKAQYGFAYGASHTQINPDKRYSAKVFDNAATIIVAMEIAARESGSAVNVYDYLRIMPAQYFIDKLDGERREKLDAYFHSIPLEVRQQKFGLKEAHHARSFEAACLAASDQLDSNGLIKEMSFGSTVTKDVADRVCNFINSNFPHELHVGPVRGSGDPDTFSWKLGCRNAAQSLRVRVPQVLPPCF